MAGCISDGQAGWRLLPCLAALIFLAGFGAALGADKVASANSPGALRVTEQGIAVEVSVSPVAGGKARAPQEGEDVTIRFKISDATSGAPVRGAQPAAWLDRMADGATISTEGTHAKTQSFLQGSILGRPYADLNVYEVLALNEDNTISVVDPLFGFGGSKLLALVSLSSRGEDWALSADQRNLYVSMPESQGVAVVDTSAWKVAATIPTGVQPTRLALQPDQHYLWIANHGSGSESADSGVTVIVAQDRTIKKHIATGRGPYEIAFTEDSAWAFVLNRGSGTLSIIDVRALAKTRDIPVGKKPAGLDYCAKAGAAFVTDEDSGQITVVDSHRREVRATIQAEPGLGQIKFPPNGQFGFVVNPRTNVLHIVDSVANRLVQTGDMAKEPCQIAFSDKLAYIRHRQTATVFMVPLASVGVLGQPITVLDFEGGQNPPGAGKYPSLASSIIPVPGGDAVLVANEKDQSIYYYQEGMAAAKGEFRNYGHNPRAVLNVDRALREHAEPGVYETVVRLGEPGAYEIIFLLRSPRIVQGFPLEVQANPELERARRTGKLTVRASVENRVGKVGRPFAVHFEIADLVDHTPKQRLENLTVLAYLAPGVWQKRMTPEETRNGVYSIAFEPPRPGVYYVNLLQGGKLLPLQDGQQLILEVPEE